MRERCSDVDWLHVIFIPQMLMRAFCLVPWMWVHCLSLPLTKKESLNQVPSADRHWNVAFFKSPLLSYQLNVWLLSCCRFFWEGCWSTDCWQPFICRCPESPRIFLAPDHLIGDTVFPLVDSCCDLSSCWMISRTSFYSDFNHSSSLVQSLGAVRIHSNLIVSWDIRCCINYSDSEIDIYKT